jgi:predicted small secreted protein
MEVVSKDRKTKAENPISDLHFVPKIMLAYSYDPLVATCNTYSISIRVFPSDLDMSVTLAACCYISGAAVDIYSSTTTRKT